MIKTKTKRNIILLVAIFCCGLMSIFDTVIKPTYAVRSMVKLALFLLLPIIYGVYTRDTKLINLIKPQKNKIKNLLILGIAVYTVIIGAYFVFSSFFDFSAITVSLKDRYGISRENFLLVSLYIALVNSILEEFFFRGFTFFTLKDVSNRKFAYIFSSACFAMYHVTIMIGWFTFPLILLAILALFIGGLIFDRLNEKSGNIYSSWVVHICANIAINTVGLILFNFI